MQSTSEIGGSDVSLLRTVAGLDRERFRAWVVLPGDGPLVPALGRLGAEVVLLPEMLKLTMRLGLSRLLRYGANYPRAVWRLAGLIRRYRIDLVHTNSLHNAYGWAAARLARRPHVWHVREIVFQSRVAGAIEAALARVAADRIVVTSAAVGALFRGRDGAYPGRVRQIANGVDLDAFHPGRDGSGVRAELGAGPDTPLVGVVCRLDPWKGVDVFLRAAALCRRTAPAARFAVVGGEIEGHAAHAQALRRLARELGVDGAVTFAGWRYGPDDMPRVHAALDVLVLPSVEPEPFGLAVLEAMATGRPVVATAHGGPRETVVDGETGVLVPPRDPERLAAAIAALLARPDRGRAMGRAGRARAERLYPGAACVRALEGLYAELLEG